MIILDTDFTYSLFFSNQSTHIKAKSIASKIQNENIILTNFVKYELATVLSRNESQKEAIETIQALEQLDLLVYYRLTEEDEKNIWQIFCNYSKKNISFVDCANLYLAQKLNYKIASFDKFYPSELLIK